MACPSSDSSFQAVSPQRPYHSYGDSITAGCYLGNTGRPYPDLIAQDRGLTLSNYAKPGDQACDLPTVQIFPNQDNPAAGAFPLYTLLIGTNDAGKNLGPYEAVFDLCDQASIAWLALPAESKVLATDARVSAQGPGAVSTANHWNAWKTATVNASITFPVTLSAAGPIYLWPRIIDGDPGVFSYSLDGTVLGTFSTATSPAIQTLEGTSDSLALIRLPGVPAGPHAVTFTQTSTAGTMQIVAVGAPPAAPSALPTVIVGDIPFEEAESNAICIVYPAICMAYDADIQANTAIFAGDGLDVVLADNHSYMHGAPSEMWDSIHPNALGQSELRTAFEALLP